MRLQKRAGIPEKGGKSRTRAITTEDGRPCRTPGSQYGGCVLYSKTDEKVFFSRYLDQKVGCGLYINAAYIRVNTVI